MMMVRSGRSRRRKRRRKLREEVVRLLRLAKSFKATTRKRLVEVKLFARLEKMFLIMMLK